MNQLIEYPGMVREVLRVDKLEAAATEALVYIPPGHPRIGRAFEQYPAARVNQDDGIRIVLDQGAETFFAAFKGHLGLFAFGDIAPGAQNGQRLPKSIADKRIRITAPERAAILAIQFQLESSEDG